MVRLDTTRGQGTGKGFVTSRFFFMYSTITGKRKSFDIPRTSLYKGSLYRGSIVTVFYRPLLPEKYTVIPLVVSSQNLSSQRTDVCDQLLTRACDYSCGHLKGLFWSDHICLILVSQKSVGLTRKQLARGWSGALKYSGCIWNKRPWLVIGSLLYASTREIPILIYMSLFF